MIKLEIRVSEKNGIDIQAITKKANPDEVGLVKAIIKYVEFMIEQTEEKNEAFKDKIMGNKPALRIITWKTF